MKITLTGIDMRTDLWELRGALEAWARLGLSVEVAILVSEKPEQRPRYPTAKWIGRAFDMLQPFLALHFCGRPALESLLLGVYDRWLGPAGVSRIQINGVIPPQDLKLFDWASKGPQAIITQHTEFNALLLDVDLSNHHILVDASGGRGICPDSWCSPATPKPVGFAGGLGPDNLLDELPSIRAVARPGWWIDMESSLRDASDWFVLDRAITAVETFKRGMRFGRPA